MNDVTYILNTWQRKHAIKNQIDAVANQTIKPNEIMIWQNKPDDIKEAFYLQDPSASIKISHNNFNYGVWARFAFALNAKSEYICLLDDDTIPGSKWSENCIKSIEQENALYGTVGVVFNDLKYQSFERFGWPNPNEEKKRVDIVGHAWFFHRDLLGAFWKDNDRPLNMICGEDVHFSYSIQKHLGLNTYVPPHPSDDLDLWGSQPTEAMKYGVDNNAISVNSDGIEFGLSLTHYYNKGFKLLNVE
tara:strand:+ start:99 stop:836 length:738 start_codon:yes stop_codon:yes gene_type:complete